MTEWTVAGTEARGGVDRRPNISARLRDRIAQCGTLRQCGGDCTGQRAAGAVGVATVDAGRCKSLFEIRREQPVDNVIAFKMTTFDQ